MTYDEMEKLIEDNVSKIMKVFSKHGMGDGFEIAKTFGSMISMGIGDKLRDQLNTIFKEEGLGIEVGIGSFSKPLHIRTLTKEGSLILEILELDMELEDDNMADINVYNVTLYGSMYNDHGDLVTFSSELWKRT